jgi:hypothetical protein
MTEVVAEMAKKIDQKTDRNIEARNNSRDLSGASAAESGTEGSSLDCRYRQIGISAVAAAARYQGTVKNPAYAPAWIDWHNSTEDAAA